MRDLRDLVGRITDEKNVAPEVSEEVSARLSQLYRGCVISGRVATMYGRNPNLPFDKSCIPVFDRVYGMKIVTPQDVLRLTVGTRVYSLFVGDSYRDLTYHCGKDGMDHDAFVELVQQQTSPVIHFVIRVGDYSIVIYRPFTLAKPTIIHQICLAMTRSTRPPNSSEIAIIALSSRHMVPNLLAWCKLDDKLRTELVSSASISLDIPLRYSIP
ncbi:hypothetical protein HDV00_005486 [Rhizophlyctis rosea]|nr:hypothetical protein HDV00_005486 [Rhizophlyctis rosea]